MASIWEKAISFLAGNLNSSRSYLITAVFFLFFQNNSNAADNTNDADDSIENDEDMEEDEQDEVKEKTNLPAGLVRWREGIEKVQILNYLNWNLEFQANLTKKPFTKVVTE